MTGWLICLRAVKSEQTAGMVNALEPEVKQIRAAS